MSREHVGTAYRLQASSRAAGGVGERVAAPSSLSLDVCYLTSCLVCSLLIICGSQSLLVRSCTDDWADILAARIVNRSNSAGDQGTLIRRQKRRLPEALRCMTVCCLLTTYARRQEGTKFSPVDCPIHRSCAGHCWSQDQAGVARRKERETPRDEERRGEKEETPHMFPVT